MAKLDLVTGQDTPVLRTQTTKVTKVTKGHLKLIKDMMETLEGIGVGLAATQIGQSMRLCIATIDEKVIPMFSPEITWKSDEIVIEEEGCLSLPDVTVNVPRYKEIIVKYLNEKGEEQERKLSDFNARVVQHELDHLDGKLIVDYL